MGTDDLHHKRKKIKPRKTRHEQRILILTEGQTEFIYFSDLARHHRIVNAQVRQSTGSDAKSIYEQACSIGQTAFKDGIGYTHIFCVFDLDTAKTTNAFGVIKQIYSKKHKFCSEMHAIVSNPCFEVWYLQHFRYSCSAFSAKGNKTIGNIVKSMVNTEWRTAFGADYSETIENTYRILLDKNSGAHTNAEKLLQEQKKVNSINPITNAHELVKFLETPQGKEQSELTFTMICRSE